MLKDGCRTAPVQVRFSSTAGIGARVQVIMNEGRKRQIREIGLLLGLLVARILRKRIGTLRLGNLKPHQWRYLTKQEISELRKSTSRK